MAGIDYLDCVECSRRLAYDGDKVISERIEESTCLICAHCLKKLHKKIELLKKHDRRKH